MKRRDEGVTDNRNLNICEQCKTCALQSDGTVWSNDYKKACCQMYPYPEHKPEMVVRNEEDCIYYEA